MQWVSSRIWTRVAVFFSYDDNNYTTGTSNLQYGIVVREFELLSRYYVHFRTNALGKGMYP